MIGTLKLDIQGYWRAGTGRGAGALLDETSHRDSKQLPVLSGRTIKGLLRDAVWRLEQWQHIKEGTTVRLFGTRFDANGNPVDSDLNAKPVAGSLRVSSAEIEPELRQYLSDLQASGEQSDKDIFQKNQAGFFNTIYSTAIDEEGKAKDKSLRAMEVTIPLQLYASFSIDNAEPEDKKALEQSLSLIRAIGSSKTRGLGRVTVTLSTDNEEKA